MDNKKNGIPKLRFPGFTGAWEQRKLGDFFKKYQNKIFLDDTTKYIQISVRNTGKVEYRTTNYGKDIGRKRQYLVDTKNYPDTLTFTRQTIYEGGIGYIPSSLNGAIVTENMPLLAKNSKIDKNFSKILFKTHLYYHNVIEKNKPIGSAQKALHEKVWLESVVTVPTLLEQQKIGEFFKQLDSLITLHQRKLEHLQEQKKGLLQKMFPKNGEVVPEVRFPGFTDAWEQRKLGDIAVIFDGTHQTPKYTDSGIKFVSVENIATLETEKYISQKAYENEYSNKQAEKGDILMTRIGNIGTAKIIEKDEPLAYYVTLALLKPQNIDSNFLVWGISSPEVQRNIWKLTLHIAFPKKINLGEINQVTINIPSSSEQKKIGEFFQQLDSLIALHQRKLEHLELMKKGLLQQMFV